MELRWDFPNMTLLNIVSILLFVLKSSHMWLNVHARTYSINEVHIGSHTLPCKARKYNHLFLSKQLLSFDFLE